MSNNRLLSLSKSTVSWILLFSIFTISSCSLADTKNQMQEGGAYQENTMVSLNEPQIRTSKPPKPQATTSCGWVGKGLLILGGLGLVASIAMNGVQSSWLKSEKNDNSQLTSQNNQLANQLNFYNSCVQTYPNGYSIVNGVCRPYTSPCSSLYGSNCIQCGNTGCLTCNSGTYLSANNQSCQPCPNVIPSCSSCYMNGGNTLCNNCTGSNYPSPNGLACQPCSTIIPNCNSCALSNQNTICTSCNTKYYPSSNGASCQSCSTSISNCAACYQQLNGNVICSSCTISTATYPSSTGLSCQPCSTIISNCSSCSTSNGNTLCTSCNAGYSLVDNICVSSSSNTPTNCASLYSNNCTTCNQTQCLGCTTGTYLISPSSNPACQTCSNSISNCSTCSTNNGNLICTSCTGSTYISSNGLSCQSCSTIIPNCNSCSVSNQNTICTSCAGSNYLASNKLSCQPCSSINTNCTVCSISNGTPICNSCNNGNYPTSNGLSCQSCSNAITSCNACSLNNGNTICSGCTTGNYLSTSGLCPSCSSAITNCINCTSNGSTISCQTCASNYCLSNNTCSSCSSTNNNAYTNYPTGVFSTSGCASTYGPACTQCSSNGCITCSSGSVLYGNGSCITTSSSLLGRTTGVSGWPNYIAMGGLTDDGSTEFSGRPIDSIFKYGDLDGSGDPGQITLRIYTYETISLANTLRSQSGRNVIPVMVDYTAQLSNGVTYIDWGYNSAGTVYQSEVYPAMHFINIISDTIALSQAISNGTIPSGSLVINPDMLGMIQQQSMFVPNGNGPLNTLFIPTIQALNEAVCFATTNFSSANYPGLGNVAGGTPYQIINNMIQAQGYSSYWGIQTPWQNAAMNTWYPACQQNPQTNGVIVPTFLNNLQGWMQATNWVISHFGGGSVSFGWEENLWAAGTANWLHTTNNPNTIYSTVTSPIITFLNSVGVFQPSSYAPNFIAFDRYGDDDSNPAAYGNGYFYNDRDWNNYLVFVSQIRSGVNIPAVMLWQIPGGHIQTQAEIVSNPTYTITDTAPSYFFGQSTISPNMNNSANYLTSLTFSSTDFDCTGQACTFTNYMTMDNYNWTQYNGKLAAAADAGVFAILWGAGSMQGVGTYPTNDNGFLSGMINQYYISPVILV